jgi:hypothetical protein
MPYMGPGFGLGKYGTLIDGDYQLTVNAGKGQSAIPATSGSSDTQQPSSLSSKNKLPISISIPGNIVTEEATGSESSIVEELFEDLSIFELMDLGRSETVLGQNITYQPIKNISDIYFTYSPKKILALSGTFEETELSSALKIGQYSVDGAITLDPSTGDLIVAVDNVKDGFVVQVELFAGGEIQDS